MAVPLVPIVLTAAAVMLLLSDKKRKRGSATKELSQYSLPSQDKIPKIYSGDTPPSTSETEWIDRQNALQAISRIEFFTKDGGSISMCSKCHPGDADGEPGSKTRAAVKAFQAISGLHVDGEWGVEEDRAMHRILTSVYNKLPIKCDPLIGYPTPFSCFVNGSGYALMLTEGAQEGIARLPEPIPDPDINSDYSPDDLLVVDPECNHVLHHSDKWFVEQRRRMIKYALEGMFDHESAVEINESMLADYIPLCLSLGRHGVGPGVRDLWDANYIWIFNGLKGYESMPELLEKDAAKFGFY